MALSFGINVSPNNPPAGTVFDFSGGFTGAIGPLQLGGPHATLSGSVIELLPQGSGHSSGSVFYTNGSASGTAGLLNVSLGFATAATFQFVGMPTSVGPYVSGLSFIVQNTPLSPTGNGYASPYWTHAITGDANGANYGTYNPGQYGPPTGTQCPLYNSVGVKFDANPLNGQGAYQPGGFPNGTGLYVNGGTWNQLCPASDMNVYGINLYSEHVFQATIVYDGSALITLLLVDQTTGAQMRKVWPINIQNAIGGTQAYVGWGGGTAPGTGSAGSTPGINLNGWKHSTGFNSQLSAPTLSPAPGSYSGSKTVTMTGSGSIYYTTDGKLPTSSSSLYSAPITVSANQVVQAIAIQSGSTDSAVSGGAYQISSATLINYPSFAANDGVIVCGAASISGSAIQLTSSAVTNSAGSAWFSVPVSVSSLGTTFQLQFSSASANGMGFVLQNNTAPYTSTPPTGHSWEAGDSSTPPTVILPTWMGGPDVVGQNGSMGGYSSFMGNGGSPGILNSICVYFNLYGGGGDAANSVGLYTNGAEPTGNQISTGITFGTVNVTLTYTGGTTLSININSGAFTHSWTLPSTIPSIVGASTAYAGFTGATGGQTATQKIMSWTM